MGKTIIEEALFTAKELEETVAKAAKVVLEQKVGRKVDEQVKKIFEEENEIEVEEKSKEEGEEEEKVELDIDDIEEEVDDEPINVDKIREEEEEKSKGEEDKEEEDVEEVPSEKELDEIYKRVLKEVEVGKLPADVTSVDKEAKAQEKDWQDAEPEGKKVVTMKESRTLRTFLAIHKNLVKENHNLRETLKKMIKEMNDINLFNQKLLMSTRIMSEHNLTNPERKSVLSDFDSAKSLGEAKAIYRAYAKSLTMSRGKVNESLSRKIGGLNRTVITETQSRDENKIDKRMLELADLNNE